MRTRIVAGNWKMNMTFSNAEDLLVEIAESLEDIKLEGKEVIVCPPTCFLELATDIADESLISVGAQNVSEHEKGAYTGEIATMMLESMGVDYCILGHSERRAYYNENNKTLAAKIDRCLDHSIIPIYCCGEVLEQRENGSLYEVVKSQLEEALFHLNKDEIQNLVIAYEPVWAIGTGKTASPEQAQEMHAFIRQTLTDKYGAEVSGNISLLYGGSCNAANAKVLFSQADVDGGLIGGASLNAKDFITIVKSL
ncbi:MAG: triose-phosphate isomerase [Bacteroidales bacterium]|nr:triose-phosphate isomerase [Bacteroidales bacterium]